MDSAKELKRRAARERREAAKWLKANNSQKAAAHLRGAVRLEERAAQAAARLMCIHDHKHRTIEAVNRCEDGRFGAATGTRGAAY